MKKGKKNRHKSLSAAETLTLRKLHRDLYRPRISYVDMRVDTLEIVAHVNLRDHVPADYVKRELTRALVEKAIADGVMKLDVLDDPNLWGEKLLRGTLRVVVPKGGF